MHHPGLVASSTSHTRAGMCGSVQHRCRWRQGGGVTRQGKEGNRAGVGRLGPGGDMIACTSCIRSPFSQSNTDLQPWYQLHDSVISMAHNVGWAFLQSKGSNAPYPKEAFCLLNAHTGCSASCAVAAVLAQGNLGRIGLLPIIRPFPMLCSSPQILLWIRLWVSTLLFVSKRQTSDDSCISIPFYIPALIVNVG